MMLFLLGSYLALLALFVWLRFIPFNTFWKLSPIIFLVVLNIGLFIPMGWGAPSGPAIVLRNSVQIASPVSGEVVEVAAAPNTALQKGDVLFRVDPAPFEFKVQELRAEVVAAERKADQLKAAVDAASANVAALVAQLAFAEKRRDDLAKLARSDTTSAFRVQEEQRQVDTLTAQLAAARANETSAELALASQVDGVNTEVVRLRAEIGSAQWELDHTVIRAPADGYVTNIALRAGARVTAQAPAMAFIDTSETILGVEIPQIYARYLAPGQTVEVTFKIQPGEVLLGRVQTVLQAIATGQPNGGGAAVSPPKLQAAPFVVRVALDDAAKADRLPAGSLGVAAIFTESAKPSQMIRRVLLRQIAILNYVNMM